MRKLSARQVRYLWAIGYFKNQGGQKLSGSFESVRETLIKKVSGLPEGETPYTATIKGETYRVHHHPDMGPRFRVMLRDKYGEDSNLSFLRDEIEEGGVSLKREKPKELQRRHEGYDEKLDLSLLQRDQKEAIDEYRKTRPNDGLSIPASYDIKGALSELRVKSIEDLISQVAPGVREKFPDYLTEISLSRRTDFRGHNSHVVFVRLDHPQRPGDSNAIEIVREYDVENKVAYHDSLMIPKSMQGQGMGKAIYEANVEYARKIGMRSIELTANCDVGGYMWGRMGFSFTRDNDAEYLTKKLSNLTSDIDEGDIHLDDRRKYNDLIELPQGTKWTAEEIANTRLRRVDGSIINLGAETLLKASWRGKKDI